MQRYFLRISGVPARHRGDRFSRSVQEPAPESRRLHTGCHLGHNQAGRAALAAAVAYFSAVAKVRRALVARTRAWQSRRLRRPRQEGIVEKLEQRAGPKARKLFEKFIIGALFAAPAHGSIWHIASFYCRAAIRSLLDRSRHRAGFYEYTA
jgi:hypothetical protein